MAANNDITRITKPILQQPNTTSKQTAKKPYECNNWPIFIVQWTIVLLSLSFSTKTKTFVWIYSAQVVPLIAFSVIMMRKISQYKKGEISASKMRMVESICDSFFGMHGILILIILITNPYGIF